MFGLSRIVIVFRNTLNVLLVLNPPAIRGTLITHEAPDVQQHIIGDITCGLCTTTRQTMNSDSFSLFGIPESLMERGRACQEPQTSISVS